MSSGEAPGTAATADPRPARPWEVRDPDAAVVETLCRELGLQAVTARILACRGLGSPAEAQRFLHPSLDELHSPFAFEQMEAAVDRLEFALEHDEKIVVHGDYDVDGISGTVLLVTVLRHLGGEVGYVVPHRIRDGYGLRPAGVDRAAEQGARLLITVDCGVTSHAAAARAAELGIDLVIADHHQPDDELPPAHAVLNPRLAGAGYPEEDLAAVAVAFKLARGLLQRRRARGASAPSGLSMLKLVALGTVADMVPLVGENRVLAHFGLQAMGDAVNPGLQELLKVSGLAGRQVSAGDVGFRLAPRINAVGRMGDPADAVELFLTADPGRARTLAQLLQRTNSERQAEEARVLEEALAQPPSEGDAFVLAVGEGWHRGVIGIVATRLVERWGKPAAVVSLDGDAGFGSARSVPGFDLVAGLRSAAPLLDEFGGHREAAGFRLRAERLEELRQALDAAVVREAPEGASRPLRCDAELDPREATLELALELERLAPFGCGNPRPRLLCRDLHLLGAPRTLKDRHLLLRVAGADGELEAIAWRRADLAESIQPDGYLEAVTTLKARSFGGRLRPQLELVDLRPAR